MNQFQRDFGKMEANVETLTKDMEQVKLDLSEIKNSLVGQKAVKETDWKRLSVLGLVVTIFNQIINGYRFFS